MGLQSKQFEWWSPLYDRPLWRWKGEEQIRWGSNGRNNETYCRSTVNNNCIKYYICICLNGQCCDASLVDVRLHSFSKIYHRLFICRRQPLPWLQCIWLLLQVLLSQTSLITRGQHLCSPIWNIRCVLRLGLMASLKVHFYSCLKFDRLNLSINTFFFFLFITLMAFFSFDLIRFVEIKTML